MRESAAIAIVFAIFVGITLLAVVALRLKDRALTRGPSSGRLTATPQEWAGLVVIATLFLLIPLVVWLRSAFTPKQLLIVAAPGAIALLWRLGSKRRQVTALLEASAQEFGWYHGPEGKKKAFSVLPDDIVVREWEGRRAALSILDPNPKSPYSFGYLRLSLAARCHGTLTVRIIPPDPSGNAQVVTAGGRLDIATRLRETHDSTLLSLLASPYDTLALKGDRLVVSLALVSRPVTPFGSPPVTLPAYDPLRPDILSLQLLLRTTWPQVQSLLSAFSSETPGDSHVGSTSPRR